MPPERIRKITSWYERRLAPIAFVFGFIFDILTFTRIDFLRDHIILIAHLVIAAAGILIVNAHAAGRFRGERLETVAWIAPFLMQFSFGALFSGFTVLFIRSGSFAASWLFLVILAAILIGNEYFREYYRRLTFHLGIYFLALFSYAMIAVPLLWGDIGVRVFMVSGLASLVAILGIALLLVAVASLRLREHWRPLALSIGGIYVAMHLLYFTNIIPPIPLSLKHIGIYHEITRTNGEYRGSYEAPGWFGLFSETNPVYHWRPGEIVYAYTAVFAPASIGTTIRHHWLYENPKTGVWEEKSVLPFAIVGGRDGGFRGYTEKRSIAPGQWRIEVRTERGQLLGRTTFEIDETSTPIPREVREL